MGDGLQDVLNYNKTFTTDKTEILWPYGVLKIHPPPCRIELAIAQSIRYDKVSVLKRPRGFG